MTDVQYILGERSLKISGTSKELNDYCWIIKLDEILAVQLTFCRVHHFVELVVYLQNDTISLAEDRIKDLKDSILDKLRIELENKL